MRNEALCARKGKNSKVDGRCGHGPGSGKGEHAATRFKRCPRQTAFVQLEAARISQKSHPKPDHARGCEMMITLATSTSLPTARTRHHELEKMSDMLILGSSCYCSLFGRLSRGSVPLDNLRGKGAHEGPQAIQCVLQPQTAVMCV